MKLAILSDTHGLLRPEVTEHLKTADAILHGGDINRQSIVDELRQYAPLYIVRGNNDKDWAGCLSLSGTRRARRWESIKVCWQNEKFQERIKTFTGWTAQIIQHEIDHCEGIII